MAIPVWVTNSQLGTVFENTNLLIDLNTTEQTDIYELVITSTGDLEDPLAVGTKVMNINDSPVYFGVSSPGEILSTNFISSTQLITGLNIGGNFNLRSIDNSGPSPVLISDEITLEIVVESRVPSFPLTGSFKLGSSTGTATINVSGISDISSLITTINNVVDNITFGVKAISNNEGFFLIRDNILGDDIFINVSGITGGDIGLDTGTYFLDLNSIIKSINRYRTSGSRSFARNEDLTLNGFTAQDLTDASWTKTNVIVTEETGVFDADNIQVYRVETDGGGTTAEVFNNTGTAVSIGEERVFRVNIKADNVVEWIMLQTDQSGGAAWFDIINGNVGTVQVNNAKITRLDDGWLECRIEYNAVATDANDQHDIRIVSSNGSTTYVTTAGHNILIGDVNSYSRGNNKLSLKNTNSAIGIQDISSNISQLNLNFTTSQVPIADIITDINNETSTTDVSAILIQFRIELLGAKVNLINGDSFSSDISSILKFDDLGSPFLTSSITDWLEVNKTTGVLTGLIPEVSFTTDVEIMVRATSTTADTTDRTFFLKIQPIEEDKVVSWNPGSLGQFEENSVITSSIEIENFNLIENFSTILSRTSKSFDFTKVFPPEWNYFRESFGSYINGLGEIVFVNNNTPRPRYIWNQNNQRFERKGILIEPSKFNYINFSEKFGSWSATNTSITSGDTPPTGSSQATKLIDNSTAGPHYIEIPAIGLEDLGYITFSVFVKSSDHSRVQLRFNGIGSDEYAIFSLNNFLVEEVGAGLENSGIIRLSNGWFRIWIQTAFDINSVTGFQIVLVDDNTGDLPSYSGNDEGLFIWGAQAEEGDLTSYIRSQNPLREEDVVQLELLNLDYIIDVEELPATVTNYILRSSEFENATWNKTNTTITPDNLKAFDGQVKADLFSDSNTGGSGNVILSQSITVPSGANTFSVYLKFNTISWVQISTNNFDSSESTWFNIRTGTIGTQNHNIAKIESVGNGWFRCWVSFNTTSDLAGTLEVELVESDGGSTISQLDGTNSVYIYASQLENTIGPGFIVETTTTQVTMNNITTSGFDLNIINREYILKPETKDNTIVSVSLNKYESNILINNKLLKINSNGDISGFIPSPPGVYNFELIILYKDDIFLGPSTFSFTSVAGDIGPWDISSPIFLGDNFASNWRQLQFNLFNSVNIYRQNDVNFGFGPLKINMAYGLKETTFQSIDNIRNDFDEFNVVIGNIKFLTSENYDVVFFEIIENKSSFVSFQDSKFGNNIHTKSLGALRQKIINNIGFVNEEDLPAWIDVWKPRLILGYIEKGKGEEIVNLFNNNQFLRAIKGTVIPFKEFIIEDRQNDVLLSQEQIEEFLILPISKEEIS